MVRRKSLGAAGWVSINQRRRLSHDLRRPGFCSSAHQHAAEGEEQDSQYHPGDCLLAFRQASFRESQEKQESYNYENRKQGKHSPGLFRNIH